MLLVGGGQVSSHCIMVNKQFAYLFLRHWGLGRAREWTGGEVAVVEDEDQRWFDIVDGHPGSTDRPWRNAWTSFETLFVKQLVLKYNVFRSLEQSI